jgi:hypothetical protein
MRLATVPPSVSLRQVFHLREKIMAKNYTITCQNATLDKVLKSCNFKRYVILADSPAAAAYGFAHAAAALLYALGDSGIFYDVRLTVEGLTFSYDIYAGSVGPNGQVYQPSDRSIHIIPREPTNDELKRLFRGSEAGIEPGQKPGDLYYRQAERSSVVVLPKFYPNGDNLVIWYGYDSNVQGKEMTICEHWRDDGKSMYFLAPNEGLAIAGL